MARFRLSTVFSYEKYFDQLRFLRCDELSEKDNLSLSVQPFLQRSVRTFLLILPLSGYVSIFHVLCMCILRFIQRVNSRNASCVKFRVTKTFQGRLDSLLTQNFQLATFLAPVYDLAAFMP